MISSAIIEDENLAVERLQSLLCDIDFDLSIDVVSNTGNEAIRVCNEIRPDLIFLDIHLPDMRGFEVIKALDFQPYVIFTTAYAEYAIEAFQTWAIDYLLKPFSKEQLIAALNKFRVVYSNNTLSQKVNWHELSELFEKAEKRKSIPIKQGSKIKLIDLNDIGYVIAEDKYCKVVLTNGKELFCDWSLKEVEKNLSVDFIRIHRSSIINSVHVSEMHRGFRGRYTFHFKHNKIQPLRSGASYKLAIQSRLKL